MYRYALVVTNDVVTRQHWVHADDFYDASVTSIELLEDEYNDTYYIKSLTLVD